MTSNAKSVRDRTPKCSIVLSNVLAVVFRPTSTAVKPCEHILAGENEENNHSKPAHQLSGLELFDQFKEANRSTMLTRLTESFDEIRLKGWVFPFTLLIKGPHEDIEVIKEAWRRHFLRSPDNFIIKDIGAVSSIGMEVIQQAPFLPLTKSLVETIAALNSSQMVATQESIAEYLAKTYQYVHVPKLNVIHDCLGILIKERKIYHTGNGYFVSSHSPFDKPADAPKENGDTHAAKESRCVACEVISKGKSKGDKAKKKSKGKEKESAKNKENGKAKHSVKETENAETQTPVNHEELKRTEEVKEAKPVTPQVPEELSQVASETASEASSEGTTKKDKKRKKSVLDQISCFIKGKTLSVAEVAEEPETTQEQTVAAPSPPPQPTDTKRPAPLAVQEDTSVSRPRSAGSIRQQFKNKRALSAPPDNPSLRSAIASKENEESIKREVIKTVQKPRELLRSKSFVAAEKRPAPVQRSNSFTAPSTRVARQISTENPPGTWDRRQRMNYGDIIRNAPGRRTIHVSGPTACNIGIVRPMDTAQVRPLSRSNSMKKETPRKKGPGSLSPPSTPRMPVNPSGNPRLRENSNRPEVVRSKSFTEPGFVRLPQRQYSFRPTMLPHYESPLQQLLARQTPGYTAPPTTALRVTVPAKGRHYAPMKHSPASSKRTPPNSPGRKHPKQPAGNSHNTTHKERPSIRDDCTSPICYDTNVIDDRVTNCMCNGGGVSAGGGTAKFSPGTHPKYNYQQNHVPFSDGVSSEHIYIEEMTSTSASEVTLNKDIDRYGESRVDNEDKPMGLYKKFTEEGVNDSLTFIGII